MNITPSMVYYMFKLTPKRVFFAYGLDADNWRTCGEAKENVRDKFGVDISTTGKQYCEDFVSLNAVEKKFESSYITKDEILVNRANTAFYRKQKEWAGIDKLAVYLSLIGEELGYSVDTFFSKNNRDSSSGQNARVEVLENLLSGTVLRAVDLKLTGISVKSSGFHKTLDELAEKGFVEYKHVVSGESVGLYRWIGGNTVASYPSHRKKLTKDVITHLKNKGAMTISDLKKVLNNDSHISVVLSYLEGRSLVKNESMFNSQKKSELKITGKGVEFYNIVLLPVNEFLKGNTKIIDSFVDRISEEEVKQVIVSELSEYEKNSSFINKSSPEEWYSNILEYLTNKGGLVRTKEIIDYFGSKILTRYLGRLCRQGRIVRIESSNAVYYKIP